MGEINCSKRKREVEKERMIVHELRITEIIVVWAFSQAHENESSPKNCYIYCSIVHEHEGSV